MNVPLVMFWGLIGLVVVCVTVGAHLGRVETEKTIRMAIEKGAVLDAATVRQLKREGGLPWGARLVVTGIVLAFLALGVALFAASLLPNEPESFPPLMGIAAFVGCAGGGLIVAGRWMSRALAATEA